MFHQFRKSMKIHLSILCGILSLILFSCQNDNSTFKNGQLTGKWKLVNAAPQVIAVNGGNAEAQALEDSLLHYTFLELNSIILFQNDSVRLTATTPGYTLPLLLEYHYQKNVLTIHPPYQTPLLIQGYIEGSDNFIQYTLTPESYLTILDFVQPSFRDRILSANMTYQLQRTE